MTVALFRFILLSALSLFIPQTELYSQQPQPKSRNASERKIGVLLVNHGSRSATWRNALHTLEKDVRDPLSVDPSIKGIKTAFMEYTEPSIATQLKEFDREGFSDVIIVPIFLTVSSHTFDDIPTIIGAKEDPAALQQLKMEKIERYTPTARISIAPNLDFSQMLKSNILRRVLALSQRPKEEGLVLVAYGDATYEKEWIELLKNTADHVKERTGINFYSYAWCGHIAHYDPSRTTDAVTAVLEKKQRALVIPVLVAHDEMFQIKIIGGGIAKVKDHATRVSYKPDSILPDNDIERWVVDITRRFVQQINESITDRR